MSDGASSSDSVLEVLDPGMLATVQDGGRPGWRRFGVPPGGPMDRHAAAWANRLVNNPATAPLLELLLSGARLRALQPAWVAVTGAQATCNLELWRASRVNAGDLIEFPRNRRGVWAYLAVAGGFTGPMLFGSVSCSPRAGLGEPLKPGRILSRAGPSDFRLANGVASVAAHWEEQRNYLEPPPLRVWPGPQWTEFQPAARREFFAQDWQVSARSDRAGYRLSGVAIRSPHRELISEPVRVGTVQVPASGQPIVTLGDGPTVGGYAKLGVVEPADLDWLTQCRPGQPVRFTPAHSAS